MPSCRDAGLGVARVAHRQDSGVCLLFDTITCAPKMAIQNCSNDAKRGGDAVDAS